MSPQNAFNDLVAEVGLSTTDVASIAGVTTRAVYHWQSGKTAPPQSLLLLLHAVVEGKITREWIDDWVAYQSSKQETEMFDLEESGEQLDQDREKAFVAAMIAYRIAPGGAAQGVRAALAAYQGYLMDAGYETGTLMMPARGQKK